MTAVVIDITPIRPTEPDDDVVLIDDLDTFSEAAKPGCGDDNPYN